MQTSLHIRTVRSAPLLFAYCSIISRLATSGISILWLVSIAEQAALNLTLSETLKTGILTSLPNYMLLSLVICRSCVFFVPRVLLSFSYDFAHIIFAILIYLILNDWVIDACSCMLTPVLLNLNIASFKKRVELQRVAGSRLTQDSTLRP